MKKHLLIAGLICVATIPPAIAVTKCVAFGDNIVSCENNTAISLGTGGAIDWYATCNTGTTTVDLVGVGVCAANEGQAGDVLENISVNSSITSSNKYCWCKMISPAVSQWVRPPYSSSTTYAACINQCARVCGGVDNTIRNALFSNLSD